MAWYSFITGDLFESVGKVIDDLHTSDEEKLQAKQKMAELETNHKERMAELEAKQEEERSKRWESDNQNGSWLAKNVRPASLVYLLGVLTVMAFFDGNVGEFSINAAYVGLFETLATTAFAGYFVMRGIEKVKGASR